MGFVAKGRVGKTVKGGKKNSKAKVNECMREILTEYHTKIGIPPERATAYGGYDISSGMSDLHLDTGNEKVSGAVTCDRCPQKFPSTLEGREDLTRHGLVGHDLKHICELLKIGMPDFEAQMQVFTQDQMDVYIISLLSTYRAVAVKRGLMKPCLPARGTHEEVRKEHSKRLCYEMIF